MRDNMDELLERIYQKGEKPSKRLNEEVLQKVKEQERTGNGKKNVIRKGKWRKEAHKMKKWTKVAAVMAVVLFVGTGTAYAANRYLNLDFFANRLTGKKLSTETKKLIKKEPKTVVEGKNKTLTYHVKEIANDDQYVVATLDVQVNDKEKYFLMTDHDDKDSKVSDVYTDMKSENTVEEYCKKHKLTPIWLQVGGDRKNVVRVSDSAIEGTGEMAYMVGLEKVGRERDSKITLQARVVTEDGKAKKDAKIIVEVPAQSEKKSTDYKIVSGQEKKLEKQNMKIKKVTLTSTDIGTYASITYEKAKKSVDITEEFIDVCEKDGTLKEYNRLVGGSINHKNKDGSYTVKNCYEKIGLPNTIYLSIGDGEEVVTFVKK